MFQRQEPPIELEPLHWAAQGASIFDGEMGDALTEALDRFARDAYVRVVVVTGGAPGDVTETPLI